jgi:hypothetical protein
LQERQVLDLSQAQTFLILSGVACAIAGVLGLVALFAYARKPVIGARVRDQDLVMAFTPVAASPRLALPPDREADGAGIDEGVIEELFSELFSVRIAVAELVSEVRNMRETLEDVGVTAVAAESASKLRRVA